MRSTAITTFLVGFFLLVAGCRTDPNLVLLEQENRNLEMALFQLEYDLEVCREENAALSESQAAARRDDRSDEPTLFSENIDTPLPEGEEFVPPSVEFGPGDLPSDEIPEKFRLPDLPDLPDQPSPPGLPGLPEAEPFDASPSILPGPSQTPSRNDPTSGPGARSRQSVSPSRGPRPPLVDNNLVARVTIDSEQTGGLDTDGNGGADGITAVIQPRGQDGRLLRAAAPVSVVVLDPALPGESARVARWDFSVDDIAQAFDRSPDEGLRLEMLWPEKPPVNNRLHVFVRYLTGDGRKCESEHVVQVDLPGQPVQSWSATRLPDRESPTVSRKPTDWRRRQRQAQIKPPTSTPLPVTDKRRRIASRPAKPTVAPTPTPAPAPPTRQLPVWSPDR